jgi:drug/metabolite transporter (DMT)-like permease
LDSLGTFIDTLIADPFVEKAGGILAKNPAGIEDLEVAAENLGGDIMNTAYEFTWMFVAVLFAIYVYGIKREKIDVKYDGTKLLGGICETIGQAFYMAVMFADFEVGMVIICAYCALSVLWGRIFLREKLSWKHYAAIACAFVGIMLLG